MAIASLLATAGLAVLASAGTPPWAGPAPTPVQADGVRVDFLGAMPEPTSPAELKERAASPPPDYLCGYVTGDIENSVYCSAIRTCVFNTVYSAQACCIQNTALSGTQYTSCSFYTSCQPYASETAASFDEHVTSCNSLYPLCFTYSYTDIGFVNYGCSTTAYFSAVQLTYSGESLGSSSSSPTIVRDTASSQSAGTSTNSGSPTSSTVAGGAPIQTTNTAASSSATAAASTGKKSNAGAIAGGVVGGVAVIAILIAAIVFILSRRKKNQTAPAAGAPPMQQQQYMGAPPMGPTSPDGQQQMPQQGYYQQPGQPMPYGQPGMQPDYSGGLQPGGAAPVYYGQDQKSMPGFGEQAAHTPQSPGGTFNPPSSVSPQQTGMSEAPTDGARSSIVPQHSGGQAQPVYEIGENK